MTKRDILEAWENNNVVAVWQKLQYCHTTGDYRDCLFVQIGGWEENRWARFFPEEADWDWIPQGLLDVAIDEDEEEE